MWWNKSKEEKFWEWFASKADEYGKNLERDGHEIVVEIGRELAKVYEGLVCEIGFGDGEDKELVISADGMRERIPSVQRLVKVAHNIPGWKVIAFRPRKENLSVTFGAAKLSTDDVFFEVLDDEDDKIGIDLFVKDYDRSEPMMGAAFILIDCLIGEYDAMTRIGSLEIKPLREEDRSRLKPIKDLPAVVDAKKGYTS